MYFIPYNDDSSSYEKRQAQYIVSANSKAKVSNEQGIFNKHKKATALVIFQANNLQCKYTCCWPWRILFIVETLQGGTISHLYYIALHRCVGFLILQL